MKRTITFLSAGLLLACSVSLTLWGTPASDPEISLAKGPQQVSQAAPVGVPAGQAAANQAPQWKSRAEYDAFQEILKASNPQGKISAADAFLQKYPTSDFKAQADILKLQSYVQLNQVNQAMSAAKDALKDNPNNAIKITALHYLTYVFPYIYKPSASDASTQLSDAQSQAKEGLQLLQQVQKPANVSQEAFESQIKQYRADFNRALGFAALQQKDFNDAVTYLKAAAEDNPKDPYTFSFLGQAYLYIKPADYNSSLWYLARAVSLAQQQHTPNLSALEKFYGQVYVSRHGSDEGETDLEAKAAASVNPPSGFNVAPPPKHAKTGNPNVDAFYTIEDALAVGGNQAQEAWGSLKDQPLGIVAFVESVSPGSDPGTYEVKADVLPDSRGKAGVYQLVLVTNQADAKYLQLGDPIRFKGTLAAYTNAPSFVLTVSNVEIDPQSLQMASERAKANAQKATQQRTHHRR
jgi:outer membrane protein assembly factor BamD (BamD/ComL family)